LLASEYGLVLFASYLSQIIDFPRVSGKVKVPYIGFTGASIKKKIFFNRPTMTFL